MFEQDLEDTTTRWWVLALSIGGVVIGVVAALLLRIIRAASSIDRYAADIWDAGQKIAGNTASIWMLGQTNSLAGQILATAQSIDEHSAAIDQALTGARPASPGEATSAEVIKPAAEPETGRAERSAAPTSANE